ncbi:MAG: hypothetical protein L0228_09605 [Planctomycetes bacterium]|nr:hypothetical protein [Planctomycetota bacterium]
MFQSIQQVEALPPPTWPWTAYVGAGLDRLTAPAARPLPPPVHPPRQQLAQFIDALFEPGDLVEVRVIAAARDRLSTGSQLVDRQWVRADRLVEKFEELKSHNEAGCHVFFGVNPRSRNAGTKGAVAVCRSVWLDFDEVTHEEAEARWSAWLPKPTIVVRSGSGIHAYWCLESPCAVDKPSSRSNFELIVRGVSRAVGADATHDVTRLLRLPGYKNPKTAVPLPCDLLVCETNRRYPLDRFSRWHEQSQAPTSPAPLLASDMDRRTQQRIQGLLRHLEQDVADRSRRDFAVVCGLLRLGLSPQETRPLIEGRSKFAGNQAYLETTLTNALRQLGQSSPHR